MPHAGACRLSELLVFVGSVATCSSRIRAVWMIGLEADENTATAEWDLIAFADRQALELLRNRRDLHRPGARMRVVTDGDRFQVAWGDLPGPGSLMQWDWNQSTPDEAFYSQARWRPAGGGEVERVRRKAICLWRVGRSDGEGATD